jgi:3'-5' exoribonuclease
VSITRSPLAWREFGGIMATSLREIFVTQRRFINELGEQAAVDQIFRVADKQYRANRQGGKYILLRLADRSGTLVAMFWNAEEKDFEKFERGDYVRCRGRTQIYNGALQMIVSHLDRVDGQEVDPNDFEAYDQSTADQLLARLTTIIQELSDVRLRELGKAYLQDSAWVSQFKIAPAAISHHHAYPGGLLKHTLDLMELAKLVAPRYPKLNADLLIMGAFLHDLGKVDELSCSGEATYTDRGQFVGHLVIGALQLSDRLRTLNCEFPDTLRWQLEHLILSHHGQLEFGSPKIPLTLEAMVLHHLDNLDAKLAAAISLIETDLATDSPWTNYYPALGRKLWKG